MKQLVNGAVHHTRVLFALNRINHTGLIATIVIFSITLTTGCKKQNESKPAETSQMPMARNTQADVLNAYTGLSKQTELELQQARAATAKYRNIQNALKDGYADISVDVENMGHHFMKASIVDSLFDIRQPEILVYNKDENGNQQLVAVEYAVPLSYPMPAGFTGSDDEWNGTSGFPLWLLHAWVWAYNPDGVFNPTNSLIHLH